MRPDTEKESKKLNYLNDTFGVEQETMRKVREHSVANNREGMQVSPYEGQLLKSLVVWTKSLKILELGTLFGYSAMWMASGLGEGGQICTVEKDSSRFADSQRFFAESPWASQIVGVQGDFEELRAELEAKAPFDLLFIDANKAAYYRALLWGEGLLKKGGFVIADNTFLFGGVYGEKISARWSPSVIENMKKLNARLADQNLYQGSMLPTSEGLLVAQKLF